MDQQFGGRIQNFSRLLLKFSIACLILYVPLSKQEFCNNNNDCIQTSFCCSTYSCVNPQTCLDGQKLFNDYCDFNFECMSRCCDQQKCSHFLNCYSKCQVNRDCGETSNCCSEGYCTHEVVCKGNKVQGDYCDRNEECITKMCSDNECIENDEIIPSQIVFIVIVASISVIFTSGIMFVCVKCFKSLNSSPRGRSIENKKTLSQQLIDQNSGKLNQSDTQIAQEAHYRSRKQNFMNLVKRGKANIPNDMRYMATPIQEYSNEYNTYDSKSDPNRSMISSSQRIGLLSLEQSMVLRNSWLREEDLTGHNNHNSNHEMFNDEDNLFQMRNSQGMIVQTSQSKQLSKTSSINNLRIPKLDFAAAGLTQKSKTGQYLNFDQYIDQQARTNKNSQNQGNSPNSIQQQYFSLSPRQQQQDSSLNSRSNNQNIINDQDFEKRYKTEATNRNLQEDPNEDSSRHNFQNQTQQSQPNMSKSKSSNQFTNVDQ